MKNTNFTTDTDSPSKRKVTDFFSSWNLFGESSQKEVCLRNSVSHKRV